MKFRLITLSIITILISVSCTNKETSQQVKIIFLHHSTGEVIWYGREIPIVVKAAKKISNKLAFIVGAEPKLPKLINDYNKIFYSLFLGPLLVFS
jgi:hypothetical protein